ncbi:MAG TPA: HYR domain-containing protein, partial [Ferruginibacter sp.]|nr:HYR domain-containing protein [Ferruginibacter sp.]
MRNVLIRYVLAKLFAGGNLFKSALLAAIIAGLFSPITISAQCTVGCNQSTTSNTMPGTNNFSNTFCITTGSSLTYNQNFDMNGGTVCVGPNVTFSAGGGNYNGNWTINNYGSFSRGLTLNSGQTFHNYGTYTGSLSLNGGTVINYNGATFTPSSFNFNGGSFTNNSGGTASFGSSVTVNSGATFVNNGTLTTTGLTLNSSASATLGGTTNINGSINNNGSINITGLITVTGNYNQNSSGSISSSSSAQCNALNITGTIQGQGSYNGINGLLLNKTLSPACGGCLINGAAVVGSPANQISGASLTASANNISGTISNPGGSPAATHYIVLRRFGAAVTDQPDDFRSYTVGNTIGSSTVVAVNAIATLSFTDANVIAANGCGTYHYAVFPLNNNGSCGTYNRTINATNRSSITISGTGGTVGTSTGICYGNTSGLLTLSGYVGSIVRWESSVSPFSSWTSIANTTNTYTSGALTQTTQFRAVINAGSGCGNINAAAATITMDNTPPVMSCPANITANATAGICGAVVTYSVSASDACDGSSCAPSSITGYTYIGTYNGHTYFRSNSSSLWPVANSNAQALGAHLVTISSAGENTFLAGLGYHWGGMTDEAVEGTWAWVTGEPVVYTSWNPGEPNNSGNQDYQVLNWSGTNWDDQGTTTGTSLPSIIEFDCLNLNLVSGFSSGSVFPVGVTTVTYNATDAAGNTSADCSFTVTVNDATAPTIVCPANITVNAAAGACDAVVNYNAPVATDNCGTCTSAPAITGYTSLGLYNGSAYYISNATATPAAAFSAATALGASVATIASATENTFVRNAANTAGFTGSYIIGINDVATEGTFLGFAGETISYTNWNSGEPNNSGNEDYIQVLNTGLWNDIGAAAQNYIIKISCITPVLTSGLSSGSTFPVGTSTVNYSATDPNGNTANCSFTVTVAVNPASLARAVSASATVCAGSGTNINIALSDIGISYQLRNNAGNINIGSPVMGTGGTISLPSGNLSATTTFNILATGSSCSYQLTNTVTVTVNPIATVTAGAALAACQSASPAAITLTGASVGGSATTGAWSITSGGGSLSSTAQTANPAAVTYTAAANYSGSVTLTLTSNDPAGPCGAVSATRTITINPLPTNITPAAAAASVCSGSGTDIQIPASELGVNYQLRNNTGNINIGSPVAGTGGTINLPTGNLTSATTFNVLATNATTSCNRQLTATVTVLMDNIAPVITCPGNQTINLDASCDASLPNYTSLLTVSDNCTPTGSIVLTQSPTAGTVLTGTGSQTITLTATDAAGNSTNCNFTLTRLDVTAPVITCPANITTNATTGICGAVVNYTITTTDNCSGPSCAPASIPGYTLIGTYNDHTYFRSNTSSLWSTANSNAQALGAHLVTISSAGERAFLGGLGYHWGGMTDEAVEGTWVWVTGEPVVYTSWASGEPNNSGNQDYLVINYAGTNWDDQGTTVSGSLPSMIEFDCGQPVLNLVSGYSSGSVFPVGTTTVTYNTTDAAGNTSADCSFTVTVNDATAPTIVCPANITVNAAAGACDAVVNYNAPVATDNCGTCTSAPAITGYTSLGLYNGSAYYISNATATPAAAFSAATALGASVATIASATENTFIRNAANTAGFTGSYLIGINDLALEGTFAGFSGEPISYTNWSAGEPNNSGGNEDYTQVLNTGVWNDIGAAAQNYIIKISCITPVQTSGLASGSSFPVGTSTVNYSATDPYGNTANCSFTVTVAVNPAALARSVTAATATICAGNSTNINIALSDNGISYQLRNNAGNINIGSPVIGTGGTISLPTGNLLSTTTFNILATGSSCSYQLT